MTSPVRGASATFLTRARKALLTGLLLIAAPAAASGPDPIVCIDAAQFVPPPVAPRPVPLATGLPRRVYEGATPPGLDPARPVIVFVHGLHNKAASWAETEYYGRNDIYDTVYDRGYKTFFVDLWDAQGLARTPIDNGALLRDQLDWIATYWGVDKVNIVAHSKGGVDSNVAALTGAAIERIVTLGSPHWGSPLVDLAQTAWFDWLAELLGYNDAGTKFLQTGCMDLARGVMDARAENDDLGIFTTAATGWGPLLSALEFGGLYLWTECPGGANDGLVCVEHARHPWARDPQGNVSGTHRIVWDQQSGDFQLDHDNIRVGNQFLSFFWPWEPNDCFVPVFDSIEPYAGSSGLSAAGQPPMGPVSERGRGAGRALQTIFRGGPVPAGGARTSFPLEPGVRALHLRLLVTESVGRAILVDPEGRRHPLPPGTAVRSGPFRGALATGLRVGSELPPGEWNLELLGSDRSAAFAMLAVPESDLLVRLAWDPAAETVTVRAPGGTTSTVDARIRRTSTARRPLDLERLRWSGADPRGLGLRGPGVYNVAVTVSGVRNGYTFERNGVLSVGRSSPAPRLPEICE